MAVQRTEPLQKGKTQESSEDTIVNLVLQQKQELAKQGKEIQGRAEIRIMKQDNNGTRT